MAIYTPYSTSGGYVECLAGWTSAPRRIAFQCLDRIRFRLSPEPYFTELVPTVTEWKFEGERNRDMLRYLGYEKFDSDSKGEIWLDPHSLSSGEKLLAQLGGRPYGVIFPGAGRTIRQWPADKIVDSIKLASLPELSCWVICGAANDSAICAQVASLCDLQGIRTLNLCGKTSLGEFVLIIARSRLCLTTESSAAHISSAVGVPCVVLVGGGHYGRFFPYPNNELAIEVKHELPCYYCYWRCIRDEVECITKITAEQTAFALKTAMSLDKRPT